MNDLKGIIEDCNKSDLVSDKIIKKIIEIIGQEEWQDLHDENNDICTTMGELIITLNGIAELEKENADLEKRCANYEMKISKMEKGTCDICKETEKDNRIAELTEQNTSLLTSVENLNKSVQELEAQIEKMKADVNTNIKVAQQKKDWLMESKLVSMILQWEGKRKTTKEEVNNEEWYVIFNMNCEYEICRMCPKSGLFKGSYEECEKWIEQNS